MTNDGIVESTVILSSLRKFHVISLKVDLFILGITVKPQPQKQKGSSGANTGVVVGVVIGVILLLVIVAVVVGFLLYKR